MFAKSVLRSDLTHRRDAHDLALSTYQQQFFGGWIRAEEALPPKSMFPHDGNGVGPMMSSSQSIDLVQDAATDCSVVASLCAGLARTERGHDQVCLPDGYDENADSNSIDAF